MNNDIAISIKNISKSFRMYNSPAEKFKELVHPFKKKYHKEFRALKDISFSVQRGESLGLVGRNGAGKSTLLQVICGILQPSAGTIQCNGEISALLELGAGFNKDFTGRDNIYISGSLRGFTKEQIDERFQRIVDFADIGDFIEQPVKTYSSGMFVRLAFANAIHIDPDILIVDEALAVGDQLFQRKCYSFLEKFREQGKTLIFVSHSTMNINQLCSRALLIDGGELILDGPAKLVTTHYERLLFAAPTNAAAVRNEIIELNKDNSRIPTYGAPETPIVTAAPPNIAASKKKQDEASSAQKAFFIENFSPKSTVEYKNYDVEVGDINIKTDDGRRVNALIMNDAYVFSYSVRFNMDAANVSFGLQIKTDKGLILGAGASFEVEKPVELISKGDLYDIGWHFKCYLLPGIYFLDIGVSSIINDERVYLNRVIDAAVFKIQPLEKKGITGWLTSTSALR